MLKHLKKSILQNAYNALGYRTNRKVIVFESDDWGSIRMPSVQVYKKLLDSGIRVDRCPYNRFDSLASPDDWEALFQVLGKYKDYKGNHPVITINVNPVNPDFQSISGSDFHEYRYEKFTDTLQRYFGGKDVFSYWKAGIESGFVFPQYHGREHINPSMWLELLRRGNKPLNLGFEHGVYGLSFITSSLIDSPYLASLLYRNEKEYREVLQAIGEGAGLFETIFGFRAKSFIAPLYTWDKKLEGRMKASGITYIQGANVHKTYNFEKKKFSRKFHSFGSENEFNQIYLNRNCTFEPAIQGGNFSMNKLLKEIQTAFFWNKPAVITTHRLNYIGNLDENNRKRNLDYLSKLLDSILHKWPDVEFMHSAQLGDYIKETRK